MSGDGVLIAIEGIDGSGKTTQINRLANVLRDAGETVLVSKEPTNGRHGQRIRNSAHSERLSVEEEIELLVADRQEHLEKRIRPALSRGEIVVLDRYFYSTLAYQGPRNSDIDALDQYVRAQADMPDVAIVLDIPVDVSQERIVARSGNGNAFEDPETLAAVRQVFKRLVRTDPSVVEIDGQRSLDEVANEILALLMSRTLKTKLCAKSHGCDDPYHCSFRMTNSCRWWRLRNGVYSRLEHSHPEVVFAAR